MSAIVPSFTHLPSLCTRILVIALIKDCSSLKAALCKQVMRELLKCGTSTLGNHCSITTGKLDANAMCVNGAYMFFTCARENYLTDTFAYDGEALLVSGNGELGLCKYYSGKFNAYQRTYVLQNFDIDIHYAKLMIDELLPRKIYREKNVGAMPYIVLSTLSGLQIPVASPEVQLRIATSIGSVEKKIMLEHRILHLCEYIKAFLLAEILI